MTFIRNFFGKTPIYLIPIST